MQIQFPQLFGGDHEKRNSINQRSLSRIFVLILCLVSTLILALPAAAAEFAVIDYSDYVTNIQYGDGMNTVYVTLPSGSFQGSWTLFKSPWTVVKTLYGQQVTFENLIESEVMYRLKYFIGDANTVFDTTFIPNGTWMAFEYEVYGDYTWAYDPGGDYRPLAGYEVRYYTSDFQLISTDSVFTQFPAIGDDTTFGGFTFEYVVNKPADACYMRVNAIWMDFAIQTAQPESLTIRAKDVKMQLSIDSMIAQQQQTGKTNELLEEVKQQLDDIYTGGESGEDLIAGSDKLEDAGSGLGDDISDIQDFEDQYFAEFENNLDDIIAGADLNYLVSPLAFVQMYLNKIVAGVPSEFLVVFTLPILFGIFLYIVGHPVRAPRPDTSGDLVTRETFTETKILTGKHAGETRSTRTVTTTQEIGRVHKE